MSLFFPLLLLFYIYFLKFLSFSLFFSKSIHFRGQNEIMCFRLEYIINQYVHIFLVHHTVAAIIQVELRLFLFGWGLLYYICVFFALICWFENYQNIWQYQQIYLFLVNEIIYLKNPGISDPCLLCFSCSHNFQTTLDIATCETSFLSLLLLLSLHCFTESLSSLQLSLISENTEIVPS